MSYFRRGLSGIQSQPPGGRVHHGALGASVNEYTITAPPPPPSRVMAARGRVGPRWYRQLQGTSLGADDPTGNTLATPTLSEPDGTVIRRIDQNVVSLVASEAAEDKRRKLTTILTGLGLVFAAAKLGFIAIPHLRKSREP